MKSDTKYDVCRDPPKTKTNRAGTAAKDQRQGHYEGF